MPNMVQLNYPSVLPSFHPPICVSSLWPPPKITTKRKGKKKTQKKKSKPCTTKPGHIHQDRTVQAIWSSKSLFSMWSGNLQDIGKTKDTETVEESNSSKVIHLIYVDLGSTRWSRSMSMSSGYSE